MLEEDEIKYKSTIDVLKKLQRVDAPKDFETNMMRRLNQSLQKKEDGFLTRLFSPSKLIPAGSLAATALIIFFVMSISRSEIENPMMLEPRMIENAKMISVEPPVISKQTENKSEQPLKKERVKKPDVPLIKDMPNEEPIMQSVELAVEEPDTVITNELSGQAGTIEPASISNQAEIDKSRLDYRQNTLNLEDKEKVQDLKQKMQNSIKRGGKLD